MAISRAGIGYTSHYIAGPDAAGSETVGLSVSAAAEHTYGIVAYGWTGEVDISAADFDVSWGGDTMVPLCDPLLFDSDESYLRGWIIADPDPGATTITASYADIPFGLITRNLFVTAGVFGNVEPLDLDNIGDLVVTAVGSGSVGSGSVTVPSGVPADRVISAHLVGKLRAITGFSGTRLAAPLRAGGGQLVLGESRGQTSTPATATFNAATPNWAAFGLNLDARPVEGLGFSSAITIPVGSFGADLYRFATPHPDRDYMVPFAGAGDVNLIAGPRQRNSNGVDMPQWLKDPNSLLDYTLRWNNHLAPDDELIRVEHTPHGSLQIVSEAINPDDASMTQFWAKGGTPGINHPVRVRWWTARGRQDDFTAFIQVDDN